MRETCYDHEPTFAGRFLPELEESAMDVLQEAMDGVIDDMTDDQILYLASLLYVRGGAHWCPICGSSDISAGRVKSADDALWSVIECRNPACYSRWQEVYDIGDCDLHTEEGGLPDNWRELWLKERART